MILVGRFEIPEDAVDRLAHLLVVGTFGEVCQLGHETRTRTKLLLDIRVERQRPDNVEHDRVLIGDVNEQWDLVRVSRILLNQIVLG